MIEGEEIILKRKKSSENIGVHLIIYNIPYIKKKKIF